MSRILAPSARCRSIRYVLVILILGLSLHLFYPRLAFSLRGKHHIVFSPFHSGSDQQRIDAPKFESWNLFARNKSAPFSPNEPITNVQSLPCIHPPADAITQNLNSFICLLYIFPPGRAPSRAEVTAVLHVTKERMPHVHLTCSRWGGPVIGVLFLYPEELPHLASFVQTAKAIRSNHKLCAMHLEFYIALDTRPSGSYPINLLRNIGLLAAVTPRVVSLDADFIPSLNAAIALSKLPELPENAPSAFVLPVFQFDGHGHLLRLPDDKSELLAMIVLNLAMPMLQDHPAQHFTNYAAWANATDPYAITFGAFYEPYVMLSRGRQNPLFSELFLSSGNDKLSLHFELHAARYQFFVHPEHFLFHIPHATGGNWRNPPNYQAIAWSNLKLFLEHLQATYQYDLPHDPLQHGGRIISGGYVLSPPVSQWVPTRLAPTTWITRPAPGIAQAFQHTFILDAQLLNVNIPAALLSEYALLMNKTDPCGTSEECVIFGPVGQSCSGACAQLSRLCNAPRLAFFNNCEVMNQKALCPQGCYPDNGLELPAIPLNGPQSMHCLVNKMPPRCNGRYAYSRRLCSCAAPRD